jgi:flavin reductase (DIM6/NTAB) family NADH-FMN oxidoreductase RutF
MIANLINLSPNNIYHLMTQSIIPRPIAWVLTESSESNYNLAPFSYFTAVSSAPPLLMFSVGKKPTGEIKDTTKNVSINKKMVIHIAHELQSKAVTESAATLPHGESELSSTGLETVEFEGFSLPRLKDCHIAFACSLYETQQLGDTPQTLIFAQIEQIYINDEVIELDEKGRVKVLADKVKPLSRLGGAEYGSLGDIIRNVRPK